MQSCTPSDDARQLIFMKQQRWLALVTDAFGGRGGIAQYNRDFLAAVAECGTVSSIIVMARHAPDRAVTPAWIRQAPPRPGRFIYTAAALLAALCQRVDVVFCGHLYMAPVAAVIARLKGAKLVIQMHGVEAWQRPSRLQRAAVETADLMLCVSRYTRSRVLAWATTAPERALILPNTVADIFVPGDGDAVRAELGLRGKRVLLTVGRMDSREQYKGHDRVIAAIPALVAKGHDLIYLVVGGGDDEPRLSDIAHETGVIDRVRFLGTVEPQRLAELYRAADLFVMPSTGEGFGIAFLEAMASGTPAIGLNVAGAFDALGDGELGTITSPDQLAATIDRLLSAPRRPPQELSEAVRSKCGRDAFAARVYAALDKVGAAA
jgi:phosphatidyl-myo-inositol dimannoside synthase